ncbi:MAG TPA: hypothetical protein VJ746_01645 [Nitrospira sp.]|nr:hypothetical protein [Nitrospira sp.]
MLLKKCGDRELFWLLLALVALVVFGVKGYAGAASGPGGPNDLALATIVAGKDTGREVERKLGRTGCMMPNSTGDTVSYLYNAVGQKGRSYLRLDVNGHVDAMTVSQDPPIVGVCYEPVRAALPIKTGKGIELGAGIDDVIKVYGEPTARFSVGPMARLRYETKSDRPYEWDLVFRNGRLVEWTIATEESAVLTIPAP